MAEPAEWKPSECAVKFIRFWVRKHMGQSYTDEDREDAAQELLVHLWARSSSYVPGRGHVNALERAIIRNKFASLIEHRQAMKRGGDERHLSLNQEVGYEEKRPIERGDLLDQDASLRRLGRARRSFVDEADLRMAVEEFLSKLPPKLRALAEKLLEDLPTHVAEEAGIPWGTLFDRIAKMRKPATDVDLQEFAPRLRRSSADSGT